VGIEWRRGQAGGEGEETSEKAIAITAKGRYLPRVRLGEGRRRIIKPTTVGNNRRKSSKKIRRGSYYDKDGDYKGLSLTRNVRIREGTQTQKPRTPKKNKQKKKN